MVIVRRNDAIAQLAEATGGLYVAATTSDEDIKKLLEAFGAFERSAKVERVADRTELYHYFLAVALLFLFLAFFDIPSKNLAFVLLLVYVPGYSGVLDFRHIKDARDAYKGGHYERAAKEFGRVAEAKKSPEAYYNLGNALYKAGKYKEALEAYGRVETANKELEFRKLHNMGNAAFRLGQYQKAIELYQKALGIKEDPDTRYNLELAKKMLQKKRQQKKEQKDQQQGTKQQRPQDDKSGKQKGKKGQISPQKPKGHKRAPITDREEKKWQKELERTPMKTFLYRAPVKSKKMGESDEKPW
jgi:Ca-activated chloride channel family protein